VSLCLRGSVRNYGMIVQVIASNAQMLALTKASDVRITHPSFDAMALQYDPNHKCLLLVTGGREVEIGFETYETTVWALRIELP